MLANYMKRGKPWRLGQEFLLMIQRFFPFHPAAKKILQKCGESMKMMQEKHFETSN